MYLLEFSLFSILYCCANKCLIERFDAIHNGLNRNYSVIVNDEYPTMESMYSVYLGAVNKFDILYEESAFSGQTMEVKKIIRVLTKF